jgi:hypothetical protein
MGGDVFALVRHPVFKIEVFADDLKGLIQNLAGVPISSGPEGQIDHALVVRLQVD